MTYKVRITCVNPLDTEDRHYHRETQIVVNENVTCPNEGHLGYSFEDFVVEEIEETLP